MTVHSLHDERAKRSGHRTREEIMAQLEARYAELEAEKARRDVAPRLNFPCTTCRWFEAGQTMAVVPITTDDKCTAPLVRGFDASWRLGRPWVRAEHKIPPLCGPEKALWEPKLSFWQRFIEKIERWCA